MIPRKAWRTSAVSCAQLLLFAQACRGSAPDEGTAHEKQASLAQSAAAHATAAPNRDARDVGAAAPSGLPGAPSVSRPQRICAASAIDGLAVHLRHTDGSPLCNGMVTIEEGAYSEQLLCFLDVCAGAVERAGTYTVRAEAAGYFPKTRGGIVVEQDREGCHVIRRSLTVVLSRDPAAERTFTSCPPRQPYPIPADR